MGIQKQLFKTKTLRGLKLIFLLSMLFSIDSFGQLINDCANNNDDEPTYAAPGKVVTGLPVYLEVDLSNWDNTADNDFCIGNSGPNDTDDGCGTFIFKNFPKVSATADCTPKVCFSPRQGCGNALGNVCFWQENPAAPGTWESLGTFDKDNFDELCLDLPADSDELAITICRPGQGTVSLQDMSYTSCETEGPQESTEPFCGVPEIVCPTDFVACPSSATTPDITGSPILTGSGSCVISSFFSDVVLPIDGCPNGANITRTWTAHFEGTPNETVTCTQNLKLIDTEAPVINEVLIDLTVSCDAIPDAVVLTATDNCDANPAIDYLEWRDNGACEHSYTLTRKYTAVDACGNEASEMQFITVIDDTPPVFAYDIPENTAVSYDAIPNAPILTATDNCDPDVTVEYLEWRDNGVCENNYTITRKWTATDDCGNETIGMQILTVYDTAPPVLSLTPENISVSCDAIPNAVVITAMDNSGANIAVEYLEWRDNGDCEGNYTITRKWTATDACGNEAIAMQIITVSDTTPPTFVEVPANVTIECAGALPTTTPTATDNCNADITFDYSDTVVEGSCGDKTYTRTWTATDACGNTSNATQTIVVEGVTPLEIRNVPADITISCTDGIPAPTLPNATTSCILDAIITFEEVSTEGQGSCANSYTITRTWTATDYCDNSVSASQVITIIDEDAPVFSTIPADVAVSCSAIPNAPYLTATDVCDGAITPEYLEWRDNGACDSEYTITRKWTAVDACGNEAIAMQIISVSDNEAPIISNVSANATINCGESLPAVVTPTATDDCGTVSITLEETQANETCGGYIHVRTWTATDDCGNTSTAVQEIQVNGAPAISLSNVPGDTWFNCGDVIPAAGTVTAEDACGNTYTVTYEETQSDDDCGSYTITRTWTASDGCGAGAVEHQTITVVDEEAPVFAYTPTDFTVTCESDIPSAPVLSVTDNCGGNITPTYLEWRDNGACDSEFTLTRKWTATDACGNEAIAMQIISISPEDAITINGVPADITLTCTDNFPSAPYLTATGACGESATVDYLEWRDNGACDNEYTITRKWTAVDACGNEAIGMQIITVTDDTAPTFANVPSNTAINCGEEIPTASTPTATDACGTVSVSLEETQAGESCGGYILVRTWTATDACGNTSTAVQEIQVNGAPAISLSNVPGDTWFNCGDAIPAAGAVTAEDACGNTYTVTYEEAQSDDDCGSYIITRTWTASDGCGSAAVEHQTITVVDEEAPVIAGTVADISIECGAAVPSAPVLTATDNCGGNIAIDYLEWRDDGDCIYEYTLTRKWTAVDACGNEAVKMQIITVEDTTPPVITNAPSDMVVNCGDDMPSPVYPDAQDACGNDVHITYEEVQNSNSTCGNAVVTRTWSIADDCGNVTTHVQQITQNGSPAVNINSVPSDISLACGQAIPSSFNAVNATDACGGTYAVSMVESTVDGTCGNSIMTRTWTADNGCGGTVSASQVITIAKPMELSFSEAPAAVTLGCEDAITAAPSLVASDVCGTTYEVSLTESTEDQGCGVSVLTRTWTAFDACGNEYTTTQQINQKESVGIFLYNIPRNTTVACGEGVPAPYAVTADNLCGQSFPVHFTETTTGSDCGQQIITRTWMAEDDCGEQVSASQKITVNGGSSITFNNVPADATITCGQLIAPAANINATDACGNSYSVNVEESRVDGDCGNYTLLRTWSIANGCGGVETAIQTITVQDAGGPVLSGVPANVTVACGQVLPAAANVTATDACGYNYTVSLNQTTVNHANGSYTITRTWSAMDSCNNTAEETQTITVEGSAASISFQGIPANITISCGDKVPDAAHVTASDANDHFYGVTYNETITQLANGAYSLTRVWTAVDACGNASTGTQIITVQSAASMSLHGVPSDVTLTCGQTVPAAANVIATDANNNSYAVNYTETRTDNSCNSYTLVRTWSAAGACDSDAIATQTITVQASTGPVLYNVPSNVTLGCGDAIPTDAPVYARDACGYNYTVSLTETTTNSDCENPVITRTWTAIDACGNKATATQDITINGDEATTFSGIPSNANVSCGLNLPAVPTVTATNGCGATVAVSFEETTATTSCGSSTVTRTWTAPDGCNGTITASQIIKLSDSPTITLIGVPADATVACGQAIPDAAYVTATDDCGLNYTVNFTETQSGSDCGSYTLLRTWSASSACGVTEIGSQTITVEGGAAITLAGVPSNATVACGQTVPGAANVTATDACGNSYIVNYNETQSGNTSGSYVLTRTWSATSSCGGTATASQTITVEEGSAVTLAGVPSNATIACGQTVPGAAYVTATDAYGNSYTVNYNETQSGSTCGSYVLTRTWSAASACGGTATASQTITVEGGSAVTLAGVPSNATVACGQTVPGAANVTATDACGNSYIVNYNETQSGSNCGSYVLTRTWSAASSCGGTATASQTITVEGGAAITLAGVPSNATVSCGQTVPGAANVTATDACGNSYTVNYNETQSGNTGGSYVLTRTWSAVSSCGGTATASQTITVSGGSAVTLAGVPSDVTVACGQTVPSAANVTATDAYGNSYTVNYNETQSGSNCGSYILTRTWSAASTCGGTATASQTITVEGSSAITLAGVPANATITCGQALPAVANVTAADACGNSYTVYLNETQSGTTCSSYLLTRTWTASDNCNNTVTATQEITVQGAAAITFYDVPADLTIACGQAVPAAAEVYAKDACGSSYIVSFNETQTNATSCGSSNVITRVWTVADACGNTSTASHTLTVTGTPNISLAGVPADVTVSCDEVPSAANVTASDACGTNYGVALQEIIINVNCPQSYQIKRTWTSDDVCGSNAHAVQLITVIDETAPELTCPDDMTISIGLGAPITWEEPVATDNCGIVELIASHPNGGIFDAGVTVVTYTATDECNNTTTCDFDIDVDIDAPQQSACQEDIHISCSGTEQGIVTWDVPAIDLSCTSCAANPEIAGFLYMGERGGHRYYCSDTETTWHQANAIATQMGGYLAAIDDPAENAYLASFLTNQHAFIGLNDENSEGNFSWSNGQTLNFSNWYTNQPNNYANAQHYVQLLYNGQWNDESANKLGEFIVEIPCVEVTYSANGALNGGTFPAGTTTVTYKMQDKCGNIQNCDFDVTVTTDITMEVPEDIVVECSGANGAVVSWVPPTATSCCNSCPAEGEELPGFVYMGSYNGHQYYCSKEPAMWQTANAICNQYGGYLASINSADENDFLAAFLTTQSVFIGANDRAQEGNFKWASGEPMTYSNWYAGQPNNMNGDQDYCQMLSGGQWDDIFTNAQLEFVLELPCTDVYQTEGNTNGTVFPIGTTTVTYEAGDDCGNVTTQSFNVTVNECAQSQSAYTNQCSAKGESTNYLWIDHIRVGALDNCSGDNGGYGDFTSHSTNMRAGSSQSLYCYPGFGQGTYYVNWACWIDYNGDGDFNDPNEEVFVYRHYNALRVNFKVPYACVSGPVRMRVAMKYGDYATPCEIFEDGEVEDYTINLSSYRLTTTTAGSRSSETFEVEVLEDIEVPAPTGEALPTAIAANDEVATSIAAEMAVKVYPNPVQHELSIDIAGYEAIDGQLQIFNQLGQQVHQVNLDNQSTQQVKLDVKDFTEGIYNIQLANGTDQPITKQFIKIR